MASSPFAIDIEKLRDGTKIALDISEPPQALDLAELPNVQFEGGIAGNLSYSMSGSDVFIRGRLATRACTPCVRCLEPACFDIDIPISLNFLGKSSEEDASAFEEEIEELDVDYYTGDELDPSAQIRDLILLEIPDLPVCGEECKGLCAQCGANLNRAPCSCAAPELKSPAESWKTKLKRMKLE